MRGTVDRMEGNIAVCEMEGREMREILLTAFDRVPSPGDVFEYRDGNPRILPAETEQRREAVQNLFERLKKGGG